MKKIWYKTISSKSIKFFLSRLVKFLTSSLSQTFSFIHSPVVAYFTYAHSSFLCITESKKFQDIVVPSQSMSYLPFSIHIFTLALFFNWFDVDKCTHLLKRLNNSIKIHHNKWHVLLKNNLAAKFEVSSAKYFCKIHK